MKFTFYCHYKIILYNNYYIINYMIKTFVYMLRRAGQTAGRNELYGTINNLRTLGWVHSNPH